jgi:hypothetical protein
MGYRRQYFTFRYLKLGNTEFGPNEVFFNAKQVFAGLPSDAIRYKYVFGRSELDGRHLSYFEFDDSVIDQDVIEEALVAYSYHPKTDVKALEFANSLVDGGGLYMNENGKIVGWPVHPDMEI